MVPVKVQKISFHPPSRSYAVILSEINGKRKLPVIVGSFEAQSIALALESMDTPRPLTHDLIGLLIDEIDASLVSVRITDLEDGVFYASLDINGEVTGKRSVDSRPSDAIAIALKALAPIFATIKVIENAALKSVVLESGTTTPATQETEFTKYKTLDNLKDALDKAIEDEEYEIAAKLRDKISHLEQEN